MCMYAQPGLSAPKVSPEPSHALGAHVDEQVSKTMAGFPRRECFLSMLVHFASFFVLLCDMRANLEEKMLTQDRWFQWPRQNCLQSHTHAHMRVYTRACTHGRCVCDM